MVLWARDFRALLEERAYRFQLPTSNPFCYPLKTQRDDAVQAGLFQYGQMAPSSEPLTFLGRAFDHSVSTVLNL